MTRSTRGVLYPAQLPQLHRLPAPAPATDLVAWFWIPEWDIAPGRSSRQHVVAFPASNAPELHRSVAAAMRADGDPAERRQRAVTAFTAWLVRRIPVITDAGRMANALAEAIETDPSIRRAEDAADRLGVSVRTLQRVAASCIGLSPAAMIRRRRLQEAAERLRQEPGLALAALAADLGYADQAHLANDFRHVLNVTPSGYRRDLDAG